MRISWEEYALRLAFTASLRSQDEYKKVGACILRHDNSVASLGYNGPPSGIEIDWTNRDERRKRVVHAEFNALKWIRPNEAKLLACTLCPCSDCMKSIAANGINTVIYAEDYTRDAFAKELAKEFKITLVQIPLDFSNTCAINTSLQNQ